MTDREQLEQDALRVCSAEIYYVLADTIDNVTDYELSEIIRANGNHKKELAI
jgi:hypothetical protein